MKVRLYSDIHLEFGDYTINALPDDKDAVLVLAGDLCERTRGEDFVRRCCDQFMTVIFILGNHEFYNGEYFTVIADWKKIADTIDNFHFLHNETLIIDDVRFLGTTLWTDLNDGDWFVKQAVKSGMNDYIVCTIKNGETERRLSPDDTICFFNNAVHYLEQELSTEFDGRTVVVTHFSPSPSLGTAEFANSSITPGFHANCDYIINKYDIDYWMYGHTHRPTNTFLGDTHVLANQRGYAGYEMEDKTGFDHDFWIDV